MNSHIQFFYPYILYSGVPFVFFVALLRHYAYQGARYRYSLASTFARNGLISLHKKDTIFFVSRFLLLLLFVILIAKPQLVNQHSKITLEGIDIILVLDVSDSMKYQHHAADPRSRITIAQQEAIRFVDRRINDAIGLVIFAYDAVCSCPITADKKLLKKIMSDMRIGSINPQGTVLSSGIITAANRLKHSKSKSKIMVVLTDGQPTPNDADPLVAIAIAKELGIKIYTVGIGEENPAYAGHFFSYMIQPLNKALLEDFARATGGRFFQAHNAQDMRNIYDTIDTLEKNKLESPLYDQRNDWFLPLLWAALALIVVELFVATFIWFGL